jgi:16S rRNA (guanine966-N2)-methyltransferase
MSVRIIGGHWRGRKLDTPPGTDTRPLLDRIKQSLFDRLGQKLDGLSVADVCAGSGSFGFEAASRGAEHVSLIEAAQPALRCLMANADKLGDPDSVQILAGRFQEHLPRLHNLDLIYADPPFPWYRNDPQQLDELLACAANSLAGDGHVLLRGEQGASVPTLPPGLQALETWSYGRSWILSAQRKADRIPG